MAKRRKKLTEVEKCPQRTPARVTADSEFLTKSFIYFTNCQKFISFLPVWASQYACLQNGQRKVQIIHQSLVETNSQTRQPQLRQMAVGSIQTLGITTPSNLNPPRAKTLTAREFPHHEYGSSITAVPIQLVKQSMIHVHQRRCQQLRTAAECD